MSGNEEAEFLRLVAPYNLRDGHDPERPFSAERGYVGRGWHGLVKELIEDLIKFGWNREVLQIKEKCGSLRFYVVDRQPKYLDRIEATMNHSEEICELCGRAGSNVKNARGWYSTRCEACREASD